MKASCSSVKMTESLVASCVGNNKSSGIKQSVSFVNRDNSLGNQNQKQEMNLSVKDIK